MIKSKCFYQYILQNDKICNHYTGFPTNTILQAVFQYLDPGESDENVVLYNSQKAKDETRGRKQMLTTMQSIILTLVRLRRNVDVHHQEMNLWKTVDSLLRNI